MGTITYGFLDEQMSKEDKDFYTELGKRLAGIRKENHLTQTELANALGVAQQRVTDYERGERKLPAALIPKLAKILAVTPDEILGMTKNSKRGPTSRLQMQMEQVSHLPRNTQKLVMEMLEAIIIKEKRSS